MRHQTKISMKLPMDFFDWSPFLKTELGSLKDMFTEVMRSSLFYIQIALIAFIFIFIGAA